MKIGSLFDGAGGFPYAATLCGLEPAWASEIEPLPVRVTKKNLPGMRHLGDVTKIDGGAVEPVDVITFGSPCQDLSIAGPRTGLEGERSGLFLEAIRIIKEMRKKTNGRCPTFAIWENVPGAFSSHKGEDFRIVLQELANVADERAYVPRPAERRGGGTAWRTAGLILGDGYSIAWRVLDAQFWGVPQRRRRIFIVADFRGGRAKEILFERDGLRRHFAEVKAERQSAAGNREEGAGVGSGKRAIICENNREDGRVKVCKEGISPTLLQRMGTGGGNVPLILRERAGCPGGGIGNGQLGGINPAEQSRALDCMHDAQIICREDEEQEWTVRRLTPTECARLQGMPDDWTDGVEGYSDTAAYKMWGNGMALPCVLYVLEGIQEQEEKRRS